MERVYTKSNCKDFELYGLFGAKEIGVFLTLTKFVSSVNPIQDESFRGCSLMGRAAKKTPIPKFRHPYSTKMKLGSFIPYLKKIQKIYESFDTPIDFC